MANANQLFAQTIPQGGWTLLYVDSQELVGEDGAGVNAIDGNPNTFWHTAWKNSDPPPPHEIWIDLGATYDIDALRYLPRQDGGTNGTFSQYALYVSNVPPVPPDPTSWGDPVTTGTFAANTTEKTVYFTPTTARFVCFKELTEINGNPWGSVAEINFLGTIQ